MEFSRLGFKFEAVSLFLKVSLVLAVNLLANESYVHSGYIHVILFVTFLVFTFLSTVISVVSYSLTL